MINVTFSIILNNNLSNLYSYTEKLSADVQSSLPDKQNRKWDFIFAQNTGFIDVNFEKYSEIYVEVFVGNSSNYIVPFHFSTSLFKTGVDWIDSAYQDKTLFGGSNGSSDASVNSLMAAIHVIPNKVGLSAAQQGGIEKSGSSFFCVWAR